MRFYYIPIHYIYTRILQVPALNLLFNTYAHKPIFHPIPIGTYARIRTVHKINVYYKKKEKNRLRSSTTSYTLRFVNKITFRYLYKFNVLYTHIILWYVAGTHYYYSSILVAVVSNFYTSNTWVQGNGPVVYEWDWIEISIDIFWNCSFSLDFLSGLKYETVIYINRTLSRPHIFMYTAVIYRKSRKIQRHIICNDSHIYLHANVPQNLVYLRFSY